MKKILSLLLISLFILNFTFLVSAESMSPLDIKSIPTEQVNTDTTNIDEVSTLDMLRMTNNLDIKSIPTEQVNTDTANIDEVSTLDMLRMINNEDKKVADCVSKHLEDIAAAIDAISEKFDLGGRIVYMGAGTSGRMGYMDASECPPTFGISSDRVIALIAGGLTAMTKAVENAEDSKENAIKDLKDIGFNEKDVLVGIAASGRTPYVVGGMEYAKELGSITVSITCNEDLSSPINSIANYPIGIYAGPEVITGSTRMKAGTVQKLVLNMISTGVMIKTGKVYNNLMVNLKVKNEKLRVRAKNIISETTGADVNEIDKTLIETDNNVALSIFMLLTSCQKAESEQIMNQAKGHLKNALKIYNEKVKSDEADCKKT